MAQYTFTSPDGIEYEIEGPDGATKEQAWQAFQALYAAGEARPKKDSSLGRKALGVFDFINEQASAPISEPLKGAGRIEAGLRGIAPEEAFLTKQAEKVKSIRSPLSYGLELAGIKGERDPEFESSIPMQIVGGLAQAPAYMTAYALGGPLAALGLAAPQGVEITQQSIDDYIAATGEEPSTARKIAAGLGGAAVAATEVIPFGNAVRALREPAQSVIDAIGKQALLEGSQEGLSQLGYNVIERLGYNKDKDVLEGVPESAIVGGAVGGILGGAVGARQTPVEEPPVEEVPVEEAPQETPITIADRKISFYEQEKARLEELSSKVGTEEGVEFYNKKINQVNKRIKNIPKAIALRADAEILEQQGELDQAAALRKEADKLDPLPDSQFTGIDVQEIPIPADTESAIVLQEPVPSEGLQIQELPVEESITLAEPTLPFESIVEQNPQIQDLYQKLELANKALQVVQSPTAKKIAENRVSTLQKQITSIRNKLVEAEGLRQDAAKLQEIGDVETATALLERADKLVPPETNVIPFDPNTEVPSLQIKEPDYEPDNVVEFEQEDNYNPAIELDAMREDLTQEERRKQRAVEEDIAYKAPRSAVETSLQEEGRAVPPRNPAMSEALSRAFAQRSSKQRGAKPSEWMDNLRASPDDTLTVAEQKVKQQQEEEAWQQQESQPTPEQQAEIEQDIYDLRLAPVSNITSKLGKNKVSQMTKQLTQTWANSPEIVVYEGSDDIGPNLYNKVGEDTPAFYTNGKVYINATKVRNGKDLSRYVFHESFGHAGLRGHLGDRINPVLDQVPEKSVISKAAERGLDVNDINQRREAAEEVLAEIAERNPSSNIVRKAIAKTRQWLRETFPNVSYLKNLSNAEIVENIIIPSKKYITEGKSRSSAIRLMSQGNKQPTVKSAKQQDQRTIANKSTLNSSSPDIRFYKKAIQNKPKNPKPDPIKDTFNDALRNIAKIWEGESDVFERNPKTKKLGISIRDFKNDLHKHHGLFNEHYFKAREIVALSKNSKGLKENFATYQRLIFEERDKEAEAMLGNSELRSLVSSTRKALDVAADVARKTGVKIVGPDGKKMDFVALKNYFPLFLRYDFQKALFEPGKNQKEMKEIAEILFRNGKIKVNSVSAAKGYLKGKYKEPTRNSPGAVNYNIERSRSNPLPAEMYDFSFDRLSDYRNHWAERTAQIKNFETDVKGFSDIFRKTIADVRGDSRELENYIERSRKIIYKDFDVSFLTKIRDGLGTLATGIILASPTTITQNFIGGTFLNFAVLPWDSNIKALHKFATDFQNSLQGAQKLGIVMDDYTGMLQDIAEGRSYKLAEDTTKLLLHWSSYNASEAGVRTPAYLAAKYEAESAIADIRKNPKARREFQIVLKREGIDLQKLMDKDQEETEKYYRRIVNLIQGSYFADQVPQLFESPLGKFTFKFWKFIQQTHRLLVRHAWGTTKELLAEAQTPREYAMAFKPVLRFLVATTIGGALTKEVNEFLFGTISDIVDMGALDKLFEDEELRDEVPAILIESFWRAQFASGGMGFFGFGMEIRDRFFKDLDRGTVSLETFNLVPAGLALPLGLSEWALRAYRTGDTFSDRSLTMFVEALVPAIKGWKKATLEMAKKTGLDKSLHLDDDIAVYEAKQITWDISKDVRKFMEEKDYKPDIGQFPATERSPFNTELYELLVIGDIDKARNLLYDKLAEDPSAKRSAQTSMRKRHPLNIGQQTNAKLRSEFLVWFKPRSSDEEYKRLTDLVRKYEYAAMSTGLMSTEQSTYIP